MAKHGLTETDLAMLTDKERTAMDESEEADGDEKPVIARDEALEEVGDEDAAKVEEEEAEDPGEVEAQADEDAGGDEADSALARPIVPSTRVALNEEQKARMAELTAKFDANDLTTQDYLDQRDAIRDEAVAEQAARDRWDWECQRFMDEQPEYRKDGILFSMWNAVIKDLAVEEGNAKRNSRWFLEEAHKLVQARVSQPATPKAGETVAVVRPKARIADRSGVPQTLAGIPAASQEETGAGEFAALEKLMDTNPLEAERQIAKMSKDKAERFLASV